MDQVIRFAIGGALLSALVPLLIRSGAHRSAASMRGAARRAGLALDADLGQRVLRTRRRAQRSSVFGGLLAWAAGLGALPSTVGSTSSVWILLGLVVAGGAVGMVIAIGANASLGIRDGEQRIARAIRVTPADYLSPLEQASGLCSTGAVVVATAMAMTAGVTDHLVLVAPAAVVALVALAVEAAARFVVRCPQPAPNAMELAWNDALRATGLRAVAQTTPVVALCAMDALLFSVPPREAAWQVVIVAVAMAPVVVLLAIQSSMRIRRTRHFLRRLWPQTAAAANTGGATP